MISEEKMERIEFKCEVVTPMFLAGSDGKTPELRAPSIKGALRFWWRAMKNANNLENLKEAEQHIFGGIQSNEAQKSNVLIRITDELLTPSKERMPSELTHSISKGNKIYVNILEYLLYGIHDFKIGLTREYIKPGSQFSLIISFKDSSYKEEILKVLYVLAKSGSIGAKNRNGYGCIKIKGLENETIAFKDYSYLSDYTSFSKFSKIYISDQTHKTWHGALAEIGIAYKNARSVIEERHHYDKRQYIASPIINREGKQSKYERYSKPYFLHVEKIKELYQGKILYLPSNYAVGLVKDPKIQESDHSEYIAACKDLNSSLVKQGLREVSYV
jgi:CRISPR-associated protein Cmr1